MTMRAVETAIMAKMATAASLPEIVWPNLAASDALPRAEVFFAHGRPNRVTIGQGQHVRPGFMRAIVCIAPQIGTLTATGIADDIAAAFPVDWRSEFAGGYVRITQQPQVAGGFEDDHTWRVPVTVYFNAVF